MARFASILVLVAAVSGLTAAERALGDGCPPLSCGITSSARPGAEIVAVRSNGLRGPLTAYGTRTGRERFSLPSGIASADGRRFVSALGRRPDTRVSVYDGRRGVPLARLRLRGRWRLSGLSPTGRFAAFVGAAGRRRHTALRVVDLVRRRAAWATSLRGAYEVETVSGDGQRLFLVHYRKNGGYDLELYDRARRALRGNPDPGARGFMTGVAWTAVASRDGRWLLTLYVRADGHAFVHALDVRTGRPRCIDLPFHGSQGPRDLVAVGAAALALSPDERALYVANPLVGRVWTVDLARSRVVRTTRFRPLAVTEFAFGIGPVAAVSPSGRTVAVGAARWVWRYDAVRGRVGPPESVPRVPGRDRTVASVRAVAFAPGGKRLLVLRAGARTRPLFLRGES